VAARALLLLLATIATTANTTTTDNIMSVAGWVRAVVDAFLILFLFG
jgi:hypothetical protein